MTDEPTDEIKARDKEVVRRKDQEQKQREDCEEEIRIRQAFEIRFPGGGIFVPHSYSGGIKPHLKWLVWALSLGGLVIMVLYGVSLVMS